MPSKGVIESWDDDEDLGGFDGLHLRHASTNTAFTQASTRSARHRESISSRVSNRSGDEGDDWELPLDEPAHAIKHAHNAGVPIPANIPASALIGGTIRKLGTKKKASKDNYEDDIEFPLNPSDGLKLSIGNRSPYPDTLRSVSSRAPNMPSTGSPETPAKAGASFSFQQHLNAMNRSAGNTALDRYRDDEEEDVFGDIPTIKIGKTRSPLKAAGAAGFYAIPPATPAKDTDDMMDGLDFGAGNSPLKLSKRKESPITPAHLMPADLELDGFDSGSFHPAVRGSRPSGRSDRSSSITAHSPSVFSPALSSSFTAESEDDGLEGLVLPDGPVNFGEALKRRLEHVEGDDQSPAKRPEMQAPPKDDFFDDIEIEDGKIFDNSKLTLNRNVKYTAAKSSSPSRRSGTTITFTNKPTSGTTRIPKPSPMERPRSKMETIVENAPTPQPRRAASRMLTHSANTSVTSLPTPTTPTFIPPSVPSTPTRRGLGTRSSTQTMRPEPTTTHAQFLKSKRSAPHLRSQGPPSRPQSMYARPPSRGERNTRPGSTRPKTPVERLGGVRTPAPPFLPAGSSQASSHHVSSRQTRNGRPTSSDSNENTAPGNRPLSRLSNSQFRSRTPVIRSDVAPESLTRQAAAKKTLTRPTKRRAFGDGSELDGFDDLPTSKDHEAKLIRAPRETQSNYALRSSHRNSGDLRKHFSAQNLNTVVEAGEKPLPNKALPSPQRPDSKVPSFARDTAASRLAREQRANRDPPARRNAPVSESNLHARFKDQLTVKAPAPVPSPRTLRRSTKNVKKSTQPLQLIKNLGGDVKPQKGMLFNAKTNTWEGNDNALDLFDSAPVDRKKASTPNAGLSTSPSRRNNITPKPALIAPVGQSKGVQMVGAMVFDPVQMKWLKSNAKPSFRARQEPGSSVASGSLTSGAHPHTARSVTTVTEDDDDDPFAGIPDIEDEKKVGTGAGARKKEKRDSLGSDSSSDEDSYIIEDFDVGPDFVKREKKNVAKAYKKLQHWPAEHFKPLSTQDAVRESHRLMSLLFGV